MNSEVLQDIIEKMVGRYPLLAPRIKDIQAAFDILKTCFSNGNKLLICGNGGSAADSEHIVGELMKSFSITRTLPDHIKNKLFAVSSEIGIRLADCLQPALPAISLSSHTALSSAISNDINADYIYAQQVIGFGKEGDVLLGISTSGDAVNVINALVTARAIGLKTVGLTGKYCGLMNEYCDVTIGVEGADVAEIQEMHIPVYHALCKMLEMHFFGNQ